MRTLDPFELLFVINSFLFQIVLIAHFALRKWRFNLAIRYGPIVYALGLLAAIISCVHLLNGRNWALWAAGFIYLAWAIFGILVEYILKIQWRDPIRWQIFIPYLCLYLATVMFYWWPLAIIYKPLWYVYIFLFMISTVLNLGSHKKPGTTP